MKLCFRKKKYFPKKNKNKKTVDSGGYDHFQGKEDILKEKKVFHHKLGVEYFLFGYFSEKKKKTGFSTKKAKTVILGATTF